jgi:uncharacterized membrane protein required for colicin V production
MIAAATQNFASGKTLFNWFDVALVLVLAFGFWRGRKNGMSKEFLPASQWLVIVAAAGLGHEMLGDLLLQQGVITSVFGQTFTEKTAAYISGYLIITVAVWLVFHFIKKLLKARLEGSNAFGTGEYYLGIAAGMIRYAGMTIFALALIGAPFYSPAEIAAQKAYNNRWYGGGMKEFKGDFVPSLDELQFSIFDASLTGPFIKTWFSDVLINTASGAKTPHH